MATTVGQHPVSNFTSPVNGDPLNADVVRSNDNTVRSAYVDHDADPGIHVQSSTLALRPAAGTAGRKWITNDTGVYTLWFDDGTNWHPVSSENVALTVLAGENLVKGDVVKVTGWNNGQDLPEVVKTTSVTDTAFAVITATVSTGAMGYATNTGIVQDVNTAAYSIGDILYANGTGGFTATKPTSGNYQPCAFVLRSNASNGVYYVEFSTPRIVEASANTASTIVARDASGNFSAGTITATLNGAAPAGSLSGATLASGVTASSLTSVGTITTGTWSASTIAVARGGTGATTIPTNGQLLIGNGTGYTVASLTAGSNVTITPGAGSITIASASSGGDVVGPASATDNALVRFDLTTGKLVQNSGTTLSDTGALAMAGLLDISSASAGQIKFPATQVASSDVNTLDDYEEGPFTPTGNGITFTSASGTYTKIGRAVTFRLDALWPTTANASSARIAGLPFAPAVGTAFAVWSDKGTQVQALSSSSSVFLYDASGVEYTNANMSTKAASVSGVYFV